LRKFFDGGRLVTGRLVGCLELEHEPFIFWEGGRVSKFQVGMVVFGGMGLTGE
jgi:hypothetical protein